MNTQISFEHYSIFAPIAGAFLSDEPGNFTLSSAFKISRPLLSIDKGYFYSSRKGVTTTQKPCVK